MKAKRRSGSALNCLTLALAATTIASAASASTKPNVLFIAVDDLRTSLGAYGAPLALTPNLDRLAGESRRFERAYTMQAVCGLARTAILTGRSLVPLLQDATGPGRDFAFSQFSRPFNPGPPETMGYSIRTATQRYTRLVKWPSRETIAEELYDYTQPAIAEPRWAAFVERRNLIDDPATAGARDRLRGVMDQVLRERSVVAPERPAADVPRAK
jgi:hypothetical protein